MELKFKRLHEDAVLPIYAKDGDACMDLTCVERVMEGSHVVYKTGLAVEIPRGYVGFIFPRSSVKKTSLALSNSVGVIDSGYRGEIMACFRIMFGEKYYEVGERVCQLMIVPYPSIEPVWADELSDTERGTGGFGSSGK